MADDEAANARAPADPWANDRDWEEVEGEYEEAQKRVRGKLLGARRLLLAEISNDMDKRAAWEVLVGPVDWEKAGSFEPQDNEPEQPNMREPDMVLTAECGWLGEMTGGRDKKKELLEGLEEYRATGREDGPATRRLSSRA